jgi:hypothetical protein
MITVGYFASIIIEAGKKCNISNYTNCFIIIAATGTALILLIINLIIIIITRVQA